MTREIAVATLIISLVLLLQIDGAHSWGNSGNKILHCPFEIEVGGYSLKGDGTECVEASTSNGLLARIKAFDSTNNPRVLEDVLVWDEDAPCGGERQSYIHYSGSISTFRAMTAGAGDPLHMYRAGVFEEGLPVPKGTVGCYDFTTKNGSYDDVVFAQPHLTCLETWRVARFGTSCPKLVKTSSQQAGVVWTAALVPIFLVMAIGIGVYVWKFHTKEYDSGDEAKEEVSGKYSNEKVATEAENDTVEPTTRIGAMKDAQIV